MLLNNFFWKYIFLSPGDEEYLIVGHLYFSNLIKNPKDIQGYEINKSSLSINIHLKNMPKRQSPASLASRIDKYPPQDSTVLITYKEMDILEKKFSLIGESFKLTGGTHCCLILSSQKEELSQGEDISRHNAFEKAVGKLLLKKTPEKGAIIILSSRINGEMVYRGLKIGAEVLMGISAPTTLAVDICKEKDITLIGFFRTGRFNIYSAPHRIVQALDR